jgi:PKD repeat protein
MIQFIDESFDIDGMIVSRKWEFDDNITTENDPTHRYAEDGNYIVKLMVVDDKDIARSISKEIVVSNSPPISNFSWEKNSNEIKFIDESYDLDGKIVSWKWDFGDGNESREINPTHQYASGNYIVTLVVTDNDGGRSENSKEIEIMLAPIANFHHSPQSPTTKDKIQFIDESIDLDGKIISWEWDFGDGSPTSKEKNATHRYRNESKYEVTLTITDDEGFIATRSMEIKVKGARGMPGFDIFLFFVAVFAIAILLKRRMRSK